MKVVISELERAYRDHAVELVRFATVVADPAEARMHRRSLGRRRQREYAARSGAPHGEGYAQPEVLHAL